MSSQVWGRPEGRPHRWSGASAPVPESTPESTRVGEPGERPPALVDGVELIGEYQDSGYKHPPRLARRPDGRVVRLTRLLYLVATHIDGQRGYREVAAAVTRDFGRTVSADNVRYVMERKLRPLGLALAPDGSAPEVDESAPSLLALRYRTGVIPQRVVRGIARIFQPLFATPVVVVVLAAFAAVDVWVFGAHGIGQGVRQTIDQPYLVLVSLAIVVATAAFHECGHAAACLYGGAEPGRMGVGLYLVWPAFYTDVTDSYRLGRWGRLRTDLGGVYFNVLVVLALAAVHAVTGAEWVLAVILVEHFEIAHQLLPFLRLDGYYVLADFTGVLDLFNRIGPILRGMLPWRRAGREVTELKSWVRWTVTAWVLVVVPFLLLQLSLVVLNFPKVAGTAAQSALRQWHLIAEGSGRAAWLDVLVGVVQLVALVVPVLGMTAILWSASKRATLSAWRHSEGRPVLRGAYSTIGSALLVAVAFLWWPNGDYQPIQPGERWTAPELVRAYADVPSGAPALRYQRDAEQVDAGAGSAGPAGVVPANGGEGAPGVAPPMPVSVPAAGAAGAAPLGPGAAPADGAPPVSPSPTSTGADGAPRGGDPTPTASPSPTPSPTDTSSPTPGGQMP